ncbi:CaiB/BaiF CoA-transferase family protein [Temperatibacter marinus]|uniref:CaiB/BaiF CoA-transferase family protein n=1 Tax=Temperatibacter marinus TaxID=1456591 RepID=A0AA52EIM2_9PROT|nr:CaiB/BaiF CoA-transferase family protein [Temperatibacter marinus]WND03490.1 CaiB/BaiF CoA-transferase family protein [Temperatibacter marinus]
MTETEHLPLSGIKVIEFTHMVMGPTVGVMLADLGADVIKIEPVKGDNTRRLVGSGAGYFPMYNRNKRSICLDMKAAEGKTVAYQLIKEADVVIENFRPGAMDKLGFGYDKLSKTNPGLIYCSEKGFLSGPYEHRAALDEVAQMMGGLAYMTGPTGRPLRAGASVIDVTGGMFGAMAVLAALNERHRTGKGQYVKSSLYETTAYLVGQHMAQYAVTGSPANPMPERISAWAIYEVFDTKDDDKVFVGVVSDTQWVVFCESFSLEELAHHPDYAKNADRVAQRDTLIPQIKALFKSYTKTELMAKLETTGLPFAPITRPQDLIEDPHLNAQDGMIELTLSDGSLAKLPALPIEMKGERLKLHTDLPTIGEHTNEVLSSLGYSDEMIKQMKNASIIND